MKRLSWLALLLLAVPVAAKPRPRLELRGPALVLPNDYSGLDPRAIVTFVAQINGPINEEWYCPKVEWTWPDTTRSVEESDCEPFSAAEAAPRRWQTKIWSSSRKIIVQTG